MKFNCATDFSDSLSRFWIGGSRFETEKVEYAFSSSDSLLQSGEDLGNFGNRIIKLASIVNEGLDITNRNSSDREEVTAY